MRAGNFIRNGTGDAATGRDDMEKDAQKVQADKGTPKKLAGKLGAAAKAAALKKLAGAKKKP